MCRFIQVFLSCSCRHGTCKTAHRRLIISAHGRITCFHYPENDRTMHPQYIFGQFGKMLHYCTSENVVLVAYQFSKCGIICTISRAIAKAISLPFCKTPIPFCHFIIFRFSLCFFHFFPFSNKNKNIRSSKWKFRFLK